MATTNSGFTAGVWYGIVVTNVLVLTGLCFQSREARSQSDPRQRLQLRTRDLLKDVNLIGELGAPLGTEIEVVGCCLTDWDDVGRPLKFYFLTLDGQRLTGEPEFAIGDVQLATRNEPAAFEESSVFRLKGFESGHFWGFPVPKGVDVERPVPVPTRSAFRFCSTFQYTNAVRLKDDELDEALRKIVSERRDRARIGKEAFLRR